MLIDSHCHLTDSAFRSDLDDVLARSRQAGVTRWVCIASDLDDARAALALTRAHEGLFATAGVHPHEAAGAGRDTADRIREAAHDSRCVAVGETGLDHHYDHAPRETQRRVFTDQLRLAAELALPVVVHSRAADDEMAAILREFGPSVRGVLHCFGGPHEMLDLAMEVGWLVSFTGSCTFKRFDRSLLRSVPPDRYMLETDAPYLAPVPHRGKRNEPAHVALIAAAVAEARGESVEAVARDTTSNALRFYGLPMTPEDEPVTPGKSHGPVRRVNLDREPTP